MAYFYCVFLSFGDWFPLLHCQGCLVSSKETWMIADDVGENWLIVVTGFGKTKPNWVRWSFFCVPFCIKSMEFRCSSNSLSLCTLHTRHSRVGKINRFLKHWHFQSFHKLCHVSNCAQKNCSFFLLSLDHFRLVSEKMTGFTQCAMVIGNILDIFFVPPPKQVDLVFVPELLKSIRSIPLNWKGGENWKMGSDFLFLSSSLVIHWVQNKVTTTQKQSSFVTHE